MKAWLRSWPALGWAWMLASIACIHAFGISLAPVADDGYFAQMLSRYTLAQYLDHRYHTWTGRLPIEAVLVVIVHHPWLWRACNSAMLMLLCVAGGRLARVGTALSRSGAAVLAFMLVMLMTPQAIFESAWWLTGSLNYLWPIALGLWSLVPLVEGGAYRWPQRLGFVLAAAWAAYCDQLALVLVPLSLGLLAWRGWQRRAAAWDVAQVLVLCANAAVALSAPGNTRRFLEEQGMRFPNFADQDVLEKLRIGLGLISRALADPRAYLVGVVAALALLLLWPSPLSRLVKTVLGLVLATLLVQLVLFVPGVPGDPLQLWLPRRLDGDAVAFGRHYLLSAWLAFSAGCLVIACACCFWPRPGEVLRMLGVLLLGLASLGMMGFSPTAYLSGMRIAFLCLLCLAIVGVRLLARVPQVCGLRMQYGVVGLVAALASWRIAFSAFY